MHEKMVLVGMDLFYELRLAFVLVNQTHMASYAKELEGCQTLVRFLVF